MKAIKLILLSGLLTIAASCIAQTNALLIDDLEIAVSGGENGTVDFGSGSGSSVSVLSDTAIKQSGSQSLKIDYDAVSGGYIWIARGFGLDAKNAGWLIKPGDISWSGYKALSLYVYGSGSKTKIAIDIKDNGGEMWRFIFNDDFTGWKQIVCPFNEFFARGDWQPSAADKNAVLDFPLTSYQLEPLPEAKGVFYIDTVGLK